MVEKDRLTKTLHDFYERVVKEFLQTEDTLIKHKKLYKTNRENISHSLNKNITAFEADLLTLKQSHKESLHELELSHKKALDKNDKNRQSVVKKHHDFQEEVDDTLEKKRSLNALKEQKITNEFNRALNKIEQQIQEEEKVNTKKREEATKRFEDYVAQLEKETEIKNATLDNNHEQETIRINQTLEQKQQQFDAELISIEEKLAAYEKTAQTQLKTLKKAYVNALKPIDKELDELDVSYKQEIKDTESHFATEITKKTKFQKEKEKLADNAAANEYAKEIKKLKKQLTQALDEKKQEYEAAQQPVLDNRKTTIQTYTQKFLDLKKQFTEKITEYLNSIVVVRTKKLSETNNQNIAILKEDAKREYQKTTLQIDHDLQNVNFTQTLEEADLYYNYIKTDIVPKRNLLEHEHKYQFDLEKNELTKARNYAKQEHKYHHQIGKFNENLDLDQNDFERKKHEALYDFDRFALLTAHHINLIKKDYDKEALLVKHYYTHSRNYTALKNQSMLAYEPQFKTEIENRKTRKLDLYNTMLVDAEKEHEDIIEHIESTYAKEMIIYQDTAKTIEKNHQKMINELMTSQALERNKDIEEIELLDPKKDKSKIKKLRRNLALKQENHDQALAIKKRELEQKLLLYKRMIENIKSFRLQSLEEADTLLMHIKDQIHQAIDYTKKTAEKDLEAYNQLYYETKHSGDLFETFQLQREEDTLSKAKNYMKARIDKEESLKEEAKTALDNRLDELNRTLQSQQKTHKDQTEDAQILHDEALNEIDRLSNENHDSIKEQYETEKRRLEQLRTRSKKQYENDIKSLNTEKNNQKAALFNQKDQAEKRYNETLQNRDKEAENYINERENLKQKDIELLNAMKTAVVKVIAQDPIEKLDEKDIPSIRTMLKGDIDIKSL